MNIMDNTADNDAKVDLQMKPVDKNQQEDLSTGTDESSTAYMRKSSGLLKPSATLFTVTTTVSIGLAVLALILLVLLAAINQSAINSTNSELQTLTSHMTQLAANISEIREELLTLSHEQSRRLEAQINTLSNNFTAVNNDLQNGQTSLHKVQNEMNLLRSDMEQRLQDEISVLSKEQNITSNDITMVVEQVGGIESNMESLKEHINSSVGLYEGCRKDEVRCTIQPQPRRYWKLCSTPYTSKEIEGYITVDMSCRYTSIYRGHQVATALNRDPSNDQVRCRCSITLPDTVDSHPFRLPDNLFATCVLTATRCPIRQQLFTPYQ